VIFGVEEVRKEAAVRAVPGGGASSTRVAKMLAMVESALFQ
jgi:hypothetical protein